jgi:hypothetical protein
MTILITYFSQSGQLKSILEEFARPFHGKAEIDWVEVRPKSPFPFPWSSKTFYEAMPETVLEQPIAIEELAFKQDQYDLIIIGYQPWFLSPSLPLTALFHQEEFRRRAVGTPIVTVIGARNMWLNAQESVKMNIQRVGGQLVGNVPLVDKHPNLLSAVSIVHWMMTGRKERKWGIFPLPGVSDEDILGAANSGQLLLEAIDHGKLMSYQQRIVSAGYISIPTTILFIEQRAKKLFRIWANQIKKKEQRGKRQLWLKIFRIYLVVALYMVAPILLTFYSLLIRPFSGSSINRKKAYFCSTELKLE